MKFEMVTADIHDLRIGDSFILRVGDKNIYTLQAPPLRLGIKVIPCGDAAIRIACGEEL